MFKLNDSMKMNCIVTNARIIILKLQTETIQLAELYFVRLHLFYFNITKISQKELNN